MVSVDDDGSAAVPAPDGSPARLRRRHASPIRSALAVGSGYLALLLVLLWSRSLQTPYLVAAALAIIASLGSGWPALRAGRDRIPLALALAALVSTVAVGGVTGWRFYRVAEHWTSITAERQERVTASLDRRMRALVQRGERTALSAAELAARAGDDRRGLFDRYEALRSRTDVAAVMLLDDMGEPVVWAGDHRGKVSRDARRGEGSMHYLDRPLVGYLYFRAPVPGRSERALVAVLLRTGFAQLGLESDAFADRFRRSTGVRPIFVAGRSDDATWVLEREGRAVVSARLPLPSQAQWRADLAARGRRLVLGLGLAALIFLSVTWLRTQWGRGSSLVPLVGLGVALLIAPLGSILGLEGWLSPALFMLPAPAAIGLPSLLAFLLPIGAYVAASRLPALRERVFLPALLGGAVLVAVGFTVAAALFVGSSTNALLVGGPRLWFLLQPAALLVMTVLAALMMPQRERAGPFGYGYAVLGVGSSLLLALLVLWRWRTVQEVEPWLLALWAVPFGFMALFVASYRGQAQRLVRWLAAGWLAASALVPQLWATSVQARLRAANIEIATLGEWTEPFLAYLLRQLAEELDSRHRRGQRGTELLYSAWVNSGLAGEPYPLRLTLWDEQNAPVLHLPLGMVGGDQRPTVAAGYLDPMLEEARATGSLLERATRGVPGVMRVIVVPLSDGTAVSAAVSPRRTLDRSFPLGTFLGSAPRTDTRLELIPVTEPQPATDRQRIRWEPTDEGWRSETIVRFPTENVHAHMELRLPPVPVRVARGVLLLALDLGLLLLIWGLGRAVRGEPPAPAGGWVRWLGTFRARITLSMFAFFLLPTALFGWIAYQALAGETGRTARTVAERSVKQATELFPQVDLAEISARIGEEVLYYQRGELLSAASPEALELGLYSAWLPPDAHLALDTGEDLSVVRTRRLAGREYVAAFGRLRPAGTLGVPIWITATDLEVRQEELAHLVLFAVLVGGALSLLLSFFAGRALARPIGEMRRAAGAVGHGELGVRLPQRRSDEFGELFASFNRMTRRLRRARARELHSARVLAWGEMARQVAHEIKNPLTPIKLAVQHIRRAHEDRRSDFEEILDSNVDQILREIDRLTDIARAFSRYGAPAEAAGPLEPVDVVGIVDDAITLYRAGDTAIEYRMDAEPDVPPARGRGGELKEVMVNLLENARAASTAAGVVTARVRSADGVVEVAVTDDGEGIPAHLLPDVFEPRFSTRSAGTGLGLAIVRRLVEGWGGTVMAESEPDRGTTVRLRIPVYDPEEAEAGPAAGPVGPAPAGER